LRIHLPGFSITALGMIIGSNFQVAIPETSLMLKTLLHVPASSKSSMNTTILKVIFVCLFCVGPACAQTSRAIQASQAGKANLTKIKWAALHDQINRCEVFCLPFETAAALDPGNVEHFFKYKVEINLLDNRSKLVTSLCQAIQETKVSPCGQSLGDFHWGCKLSDNGGKKVYSIFIDDTGKIVVVNGKKMRFQGGIDAWFKTNFSNRFDDLGE